MTGELAKAVCQVMRAVRSVPETGYNQHGKYKYASDADLLGSLQPAMADAGLALIPRSVRTSTVQHGESKSGNSKWRTDLVVTYALLHTSGESAEVEAPGCGIDNDDKGTYKAMTGALKYALRHLFLVPTGEDAERTARDDDRDERPRDRQPERQPEPRLTRSEWDPEAWRTALAAKGDLDLDEVVWWVVTQSESKTHPKDMDDDERARALRFFTGDLGGERVRAAVGEVRSELQRAFFSRWSVEFPEPRKRDGVSDEDRERAAASSDANRKIVMRQWYGVESVKQVPIRAALKGEHGIPWLRDVSPGAFAAAVDGALYQGPSSDPTEADDRRNGRAPNDGDDDGIPF